VSPQKFALLVIVMLQIGHWSATAARADFLLGSPVNFGAIVNSDANENHPTLSFDGRTLYFFSNREGGAGGTDIWTSERTSLDAEWSDPISFSAASGSANEYVNFLSSDGKTFLFNDGGLPTEQRIYQITRGGTEEAWGARTALPSPINDGVSNSRAGYLSEDGLSLMFESDREGGEGDSDIWEATRTGIGEPWKVRNVGSNVNSSEDEVYPILSKDALTLVFASRREGGEGGMDLWMSKRASRLVDWEPATNLGPTVNTPGAETPGQIWWPGNLLLFKSGGTKDGLIRGLPGEGGADLFFVSVAESTCSLNSMGDLDGDGAVAFSDFLILASNFGESAISHTAGDIDCDGTVAFNDFLSLASNFGTAVAAAPVPEPTSEVPLLLASITLAAFRRHRRTLTETQP